MLVDTFHMNIEEPEYRRKDPILKNDISHVHFADSNRWPPVVDISILRRFDALDEIRYKGAISAEVLPKPPQKSVWD